MPPDSRPRGIDDPIESQPEDLLERAEFAAALARQIVAVPRSHGTVSAVLGRWGDGKTSVLHLTAEQVRILDPDALVFTFNPWLFEGSEQLVARYLTELRGVLGKRRRFRRRLNDRADKVLARYGAVLGSLGEAAQQARAARTVHDAREDVHTVLEELGRRVVVLVDDIDRLTSAEIRDVMRLVKLVADFPNTVFVLAFDRERVERALGEGFGGLPEEQAREGRAFVEKIVQISAELPVVSRERYAFLFRHELAETLRRGGREVPADRRWDAVLRRIILPLVRNLRDMRRYFAGLGMTIELIGDEVALTDVLALDAIRIFRPDVAVRLSAASASLTSIPVKGFPEFTRAAKEELEALVKDLAAHGALLDAILRLLFPAGSLLLGGSGTSADEASWRRERRVSVEQNLEFYFAKRPGLGDVSNSEVDAVLSALGEREHLEALLRPLDGRRFAALLTRLADHREVFRADHVETAPTVFFSRFDRLPATDPRNLGFDDQSQLLGLIGAMLNLTPELEQSRAYRALFRDAPSLSARFVLLARSRSADGMLPEMATATRDELVAEHRRELHAATPRQLEREAQLARLFTALGSSDGGPARLRSVCEDDALLLRLLERVMLMTYDERRGQHQLEMPWENLLEIFARPWLERRIAALETTVAASARPTPVKVARTYLDTGGPMRPPIAAG